MTRLALALALATPLSAAAATEPPQAELFAGYSYAHTSADGLHGWQAGFDYSLKHSFGLELAVSGHYGSDLGTDISQESLFLGPRYAWVGYRLTPFVHLLGGAVKSSAGIDVFEVSIRESDTAFGGALGAGLDVGLGERWAVRLQGDYVLRDTEIDTESDFRASVGFVYRFGRR